MAEERHLSALLLFGMLAAWPLFCWFFLRRGYSRSLRQAVVFYCIVNTSIGIIGHL